MPKLWQLLARYRGWRLSLFLTSRTFLCRCWAAGEKWAILSGCLQPGSWDLGYWVQEQLKEIRRRLLSWFSQHAVGIEDRDHFKDIVSYQSFARRSPPRTASPILRRVPMRKYSANRSFNSGNLAIDFPVRISPTIDGD